MGAQVAALLRGPAPLGDVPPPGPDDGALRLPVPDRFDLDDVARSTGGVALAPSAYDGRVLHRVLPGGRVRVAPDLQVTWTGAPTDVAALLTTVLGLDDDLTGLWEACAAVPRLAWVAERGAGRVLRAPTVFEDLVGLLAATGGSFASARSRVRRLVATTADGTFPDPAAVAGLGEPALRGLGWGHRAGPLAALAVRVADGRLDPEAWRALDDEQVQAQVQALPGFGPFTAASLLPLLGRPRPLVLDAWLARQVTPEELHEVFVPLGRWAGTALWLDVLGPAVPLWGGPALDLPASA
jgi:hypothetical protein